MMSFFENKMIPFMAKISQMRYLQVLRDAFMLSFPATIFGSFCVVLMNLPGAPEGFTKIVSDIFGNGNNATMAIMSIFVTFGIGFNLSKSRELDDDAAYVGMSSLVAFLLVTPAFIKAESGEIVNGVYGLSYLGAAGMFVGMIVAFLAAEIYCYVVRRGWKISMPAMVPPTVSKSFSALIPMLVALTAVTLINYGITTIAGADLHALIQVWIQAPLVGIGGTFGAYMFVIFLTQFLWFFGIHGANIVGSVTKPIYEILRLENLEAFQAGAELPNIVSQSFHDVFFSALGGSGMTIGVVLVMIFVMRSKTLKSLGKLSLGSGVFNVNEPVIFGLPIVLNPLAFFPFVFGTMASSALAYFAMASGMVPLATGVAVPWTTPIFISGMMATNSIRGGLLQLAQVALVAIIWYPFLKIMDKQYREGDSQEESA